MAGNGSAWLTAVTRFVVAAVFNWVVGGGGRAAVSTPAATEPPPASVMVTALCYY